MADNKKKPQKILDDENLESTKKRQSYLIENNRSIQRVKLCTSQRDVRCQVFEGPSAFSSFRLFALTTSGRDEGSFKFEMESI